MKPSSKERKFTRFAPRRDGSSDKKKVEAIPIQRKKEESERKVSRDEEELKRVQMEERTRKNINKEPIVKKEWIIPAAE